MAGSAIITVDGITLPNTLPQAQFDPLVVTGTVGIWDAKNVRSWPKQGAPDGANRTLLNLVRGGVDADVSTDFTWGAAGGFVRPAATSARISLGVHDLSTGAHGYVFEVWVKLPSVPTAFTPLIGRLNATSSGADNQFCLSIGGDGKPRADLIFLDADGVTQKYIFLAAPNAVTAGVHQFALSVTFAGNTPTYKLFQNGAEIASAAFAGARLNPSTLPIGLGNRHGASAAGSMTGVTYYRVLIEDLTASGSTGAQAVAADWAAFQGKYS